MARHRPEPITKAQAARAKKVTPGAVSHALKPGGGLVGALLPTGRLDAASDAYRAWLAADGAPSPTPERPLRRARSPTALRPDSAPHDSADAILDLTVRQITERYGSIQGARDVFELRKMAANTARIESRNERDEGRLISRELVRVHVLGLLQQITTRLLSSAPTTIAIRTRSATTFEEARTVAREIIAAELAAAKQQRITAALSACRAGDNPPQVAANPEQSHDAIAANARALLVAKLRNEAPVIAAATIEAVWKTLARVAGGDRFDPAIFQKVMAALPDVESEALHMITIMVRARIDAASTAAREPTAPEEPETT